MTSQMGIEPHAALYLQVGVQALEALERGDGHQEVPASIPHQTLHLPFIISLAWTAKPVIEQVVGSQLGEHPGPLTAASPIILATARVVLSYRMLQGSPLENAKAETCPSQKASVVSAGYAFT